MGFVLCHHRVVGCGLSVGCVSGCVEIVCLGVRIGFCGTIQGMDNVCYTSHQIRLDLSTI